MSAQPTKSPRICAIVVTRNRRALLSECLRSLESQSRALETVLVVDNASSDGTREMVGELFPAAEVVTLATNGGGAGGFHEGMRRAHAQGFDWLWLMDDDTVPSPTALERLIASAGSLGGPSPPALLASKVVWTDGTLHPKNLPNPRFQGRFSETFLSGAERGLVLIRNASFVSILVHRSAVEQHGLPFKHYFIWGDDYEYTARILRDAPGYLVPTSIVEHRTPAKQSVHEQGSPQYYFEVRNKLFMLRGRSWSRREKVFIVVGLAMGIYQYLVGARLHPRALAILGRAVRDGLTQRAE